MALPLQFLIDTPQQRIKTVQGSPGLTYEALSVLCAAEDWDIAASTGAYLDGISGTAMTMPGPKTAAWVGTNTGITAKLARTDFVLDDSTNWTDNLLFLGDCPFYNYQAANTGAGVGGVSNATFLANQAMYVEFFIDQTNADPNGVFQCGWNTIESGASGTELRFYGDGGVDVGKDGELLGHYSTKGKSAKHGQTDELLTGQSGPIYIGVMIIPFRERELLLISTEGGGCVHIFDDIPEGTVSPIITQNTKFWFFVPGSASGGLTPNVRVSVLQFASSAVLVSKKSFWRFNPGASPLGGFSTWQSADLSFGSPTSAVSVNDGVNPAIAYANNTNGVRLALALTGSTRGGYATSPYIFGARGYTTTQVINTHGGGPGGAGVDLTAFVAEGLHLEVTDSISGASGHVEIVDPDDAEAAGAPAIDTQTNRPCQLFDENGQIFEATFNTPKKVYSTVFDPALDGADDCTKVIERVHADLKDLWKVADNYMFSETIPLDGMSLGYAYALLCSMMGLNSRTSTVFDSVILPNAGNPTKAHEFNLQVKPGDKGSEWLDRLHKTWCGTAFHGIAGLDYSPGNDPGTFELLDPSDMPTDPFVTLYDGFDSASAEVAVPDYTNYFRSFDAQQIEPEANAVYVVSRDIRSGRPIVYYAHDFASMDPTTTPALRPSNWLGEPRKFSWIDESLPDIGACTYVGDLLAQRLFQQRVLIQFEAEYQPGLVRGQMVRLVGTRMGDVTARIRSLSIDFDHVSTEPGFATWRPVRYVAQIGTDVSALHSFGTTLHAIAADWKTRAISKNQFMSDDIESIKVWARPYIIQGAA